MPPVLSTRALNRALLARQMLLTRVNLPVLEAIKRLVGIQAQDPNAPYFTLWTRIEEFRPEDLSSLIQDKKVVRLSLMRSTIHLVSSQDSLSLRPLVQPVQESVLKSSFGKALNGLDVQAVVDTGRSLIETNPLTFSELGKQLNAKWPDVDSAALAAVIRTFVPLVQLPPRGLWGMSGQAIHTSSEAWLGNLPFLNLTINDLILRYLAVFGPATIQDIQVWSGLTKLKEKVEQLRPQLTIFHDDQGNELFDIPDAPRPDQNILPPPRFLGGFDNILLSYADRKRIIEDEYRNKVFTKNGIIKPTILIDGFVSGTWKVQKEKGSLRLMIELFKKLPSEELKALTKEGTQLLDFIAGRESSHVIQFF
ncbi:winged helix DNA-binding domain-containing protein [Bacillus sp. FJAT-29953]|nr:winged helix DNA-binding domain-containing protein [Bacillus sp. FJAT-29953]